MLVTSLPVIAGRRGSNRKEVRKLGPSTSKFYKMKMFEGLARVLSKEEQKLITMGKDVPGCRYNVPKAETTISRSETVECFKNCSSSVCTHCKKESSAGVSCGFSFKTSHYNRHLPSDTSDH